MTPRARARAAVRDMAAGAAGPRLRSRWRRISAGRIAHICLRTVEFAAALFIVGGLILASVLARGPIRLVGLHDQIEASLRERVGDSYALTLGPTYIMHDSWGVGLGFKGLTLRDAAGRTVLSAPGGKVGLDPFALALLDVKVRRLELDGLDLRLRVAADGALSLAVANDSGATPIPLPGGGSRGRGGARPRRFRPLRRRSHGRRRPGARPADPRQRLFRDPERCDATPGRLQGFRRRVRPFGLDARTPRSRRPVPPGRGACPRRPPTETRRRFRVEARDLSLADLQAFDKRPPPLTAEGPIAIRIEAEVTPQSTLRTFTGRFSIGAGRVRFNNPDAVPFFIDEATGAVAWDEDARRYRVDKLEVLSGQTHVNMQGSLAPPADADKVWTAHLEARDAQFSPERAGANPVELESIVVDTRYLAAAQRFIVDGLTARGPTVDLSLKAESAPDGDGSSLKLDLEAGPSATLDLVRLWPQFINPDVREWCAHNLHGGRLQGTMKANWTAADLDAMAHKRGLPRESLHGEFTTRDVGVDLMPGLPMMMTDEGSGSFTGHEFSLSGNRAFMTLSPTRRVQASDLAFSIADITPRPIVDASSHAHMTGTADSLADLLMREPLRRQAGLDDRSVDRQGAGGRRSRPRSQAREDRASRRHAVPRERSAQGASDREVPRR